MGIACSGMMLLYLHFELSYDRFYENADQIWRVVASKQDGDQIHHSALIPIPMSGELVALSEMNKLTEVGGANNLVVKHRDTWIKQEGIATAGPGVFDVFSLSLLLGDAQTALSLPNSIVLTESLALKFFGKRDVVGEIFETERQDYTITGVIADVPANTHWPFQALRSNVSDDPFDQIIRKKWGFASVYVYFKAHDKLDVAQLEEKINTLAAAAKPSDHTTTYHFSLQRLTDIHLHSQLENEISAPANLQSLLIYIAISILVLLVACINFINLLTAQSANRIREIGIRKVSGAGRRQLIVQLLGESLLIAGLAALLGYVLIETVLPTFNYLVARPINLEVLDKGYLFGGIAVVTIVVGILAGSYPAFVISSYKPTQIFQKTPLLSRRGTSRRILVVVQLAVCVALVICVGVLYTQFQYIQKKTLGFEKDNLISVSNAGGKWADQYKVFKQRLLQHSAVKNVTAAMGQPGIWAPENAFVPDSSLQERHLVYRWMGVDDDFLETFQLKLVEGRDLSGDFTADATENFILNQSAVEALALENPLGEVLQLKQNDRKGRVVGVVEDFHHNSLHQAIQPLLIYKVEDVFFSSITIRFSAENGRQVLADIRDEWQRLYPTIPFEYSFYDEELAELYAADTRLGQLGLAAALLAVIIACMGLFGLGIFVVASRQKEISIRKILGATFSQIIGLLSVEYIRLIGLALLIASPLAYLGMRLWLNNFAYRAEISPFIFVLSGLVVLAATVVTVSFQSIRAAILNPVESLRRE